MRFNFRKTRIQILYTFCFMYTCLNVTIPQNSQNKIENGFKEGYWETYEDNGQVIVQCNYLHDTLHGELTKLNKLTGKFFYYANYCKGQLHGLFKYYWANGKIEREGYFYKGVIDSISKSYDLNGHLMYCTTYRKGMPIGLFESYYWSGKVEYQFWYKDGIRSDTSIWYDSKGKYSCMIIKDASQYPKVFHLKRPNGELKCSLDVSKLLSDTINSYHVYSIYKRRFLSKENLWVGWRYKHINKEETLDIYFNSFCNKVKTSKCVFR